MDIDEQTRQGLNICSGCNKPKEMYYRPYCPTCEAPQLQSVQSINYMEILNYIERVYPDIDQEELRQYMTDTYEFRNDSYFIYYINKTNKADRILNHSKGLIALEDYLLSVGVKEESEVLFWVSW